MKQQLYANPIVGRTGLGNMLFPWARAEVFCKKNGASMLAPQWVNFFRVGPWLRGERDKRYYLSSFSNVGYVHGLHRQLVLHTIGHVGETDLLEKPMTRSSGKQIVDFKGMDCFFSPFLSDQEFVKKRLYAVASRVILKQIEQFPDQPFIGVHIRRGDFLHGGIAIDDAWYLRAIEVAAATLNKGGGGFLIRIFSDASPDALRFLTDGFPNVTIMPKAPALLDMLLLSRCQALIGTSRSTFSMWAVFLGQMPSFWHPCYITPPLSVSPRATVTMID